MTSPIFFTSARNYMKRDPSSGSTSMAAPATNVSGYYVTNLVITHNLGFLPVFKVGYEPFKDGIIWPPMGNRNGASITSPIDGTTRGPVLLVWPTATTLTIQLFYTDNTLTGTYPVYWDIYKVAAL